MNTQKESRTYGLLAEFDSPTEIVAAAKKAHQAGYRKMDAYSPFPIEALSEAIGFHKNSVPLIVLAGGLIGLLSGLGLQIWTSAIDYPLNVGGRPYISWPSFIPITFELTILLAAFGAVLGMFALNGLPQPYHPLFNSPRFELASRTHFFLCIEAKDPKFDPAETRRFLESLGANEVTDVEN
jgi:hypothetical protein